MTAEIDTPAVLIDIDRVDRNVERMSRLARDGGIELRPHAKSHKIPELAWRQVRAGAAGITCQKLGEAEVMARAGIPDILISYPIVGRTKVERLLDLAERTRVTTVVDDLDAAQSLERAAGARGIVLDTMIEVEVGYRRCGVPAGRARQFAEALAERGGHLRLAGLLAYEGHIYEVPDRRTAELRARASYDLLGEAAQDIRDAGIAIDRVSVGGTAAAGVAAQHAAITELRAGSYIFNDRVQMAMGAAEEADCACTVLTTVVSTAAGSHFVVDAGSKALSFTALPGSNSYAAVLGRPELQVDRLSDEHGMVSLPAGAPAPRVGDRLRLLPNAHAAVIDNFAEAVALRGGEPVGTLAVEARGCMR
jgi:D-serine deaminase-like pyridoxal phosphate-dependent protein